MADRIPLLCRNLGHLWQDQPELKQKLWKGSGFGPAFEQCRRCKMVRESYGCFAGVPYGSPYKLPEDHET